MRSAPIITGETIYTGNLNAARADASAAAVLSAHQMLGQIAMGTNPSNTQTLTLTINGTAIVIHFVTAIGAVANNVLIGSTAAITAQNLYNFLTNPSLTNTTQVAATTANQTLLSYLCFGVSTTTTTVGSMNKTIYAPLTTFTCSTTVTSGTYTASTVKLYIEPGVIYVNGTEVYFLGGATPAVTAPSVNPRIDVLTIDNTGTLAWTTGAENASPVAPTYPINKMPICEIKNVVGQTIINDNENQATGQGFILNDVRPFLDDPLNFAAIPDDMIPDADGTRSLGSPSKQWNNIYAKTGMFVGGVALQSRFGGTGADGALTVTSGTTSISLGNALFFEKNYTSISITGTGKVAFTTPNNLGTFIAVRSQGNVTLTSSATPMLDASGCGAQSGFAGIATNGASVASGGNAGDQFGGTFSGAAGGTSNGVDPNFIAGVAIFRGFLLATGGSGGPSTLNGGIGSGTTPGGAGGGALYLECAAALNFTTTAGISVAGIAGVAVTNYGGCGGGAGGTFFCAYNTLTSNTGTVTVSGGAGATGTTGGTSGTAGNGSSGTGVGGNGGSSTGGGSGHTNPGSGGGGSFFATAAGGNGGNSSGAEGGGGGGASGIAKFIANTYFA